MEKIISIKTLFLSVFVLIYARGLINKEGQMKTFLSLFTMCLVVMPAFGAPGAAGHGRQSMSQQMVVAAPRQASMSSKHVGLVSDEVPYTNNGSGVQPGGDNSTETDKPDSGNDSSLPVVDNREKERNACLNGNIGLGNVFVWASRYSNTANYASMVEDVENPENNVCFVRVELKSTDTGVNLTDIPSQYFEMGRMITCGEWANEDVVKKRILDAKKSARTWGTVGGAVGGAALGVGAMELFGNKLIGGKVQGQKALDDEALLISQLKVLQKDNNSKFTMYMDSVRALLQKCDGQEESVEECKNLNKYKSVQAAFSEAY